MTKEDFLQNFYQNRETMHQAGGPERVQKQHDKGKWSARERVEALVDQGSFTEHQTYIQGRSPNFGLDKKRFFGDGVVSGAGAVGGKRVYLSSQDFTVLGGSLGEMHAERIAEAQMLAVKTGSPFIQINDSGGARIQEGILSLQGYAKIFKHNTLASGVVPQFSIILGPCAGGAVYSPGITDFVCMVDNVSNMYITGPDVIKAVTGEDISHEKLGGAVAHAAKSGVAHFRFKSEEECFATVKQLISYLPSNNKDHPPVIRSNDDPNRETPGLYELIPDDPRKPYDVKEFINSIFDANSFIEVHKDFAPNMVVGFAKMQGQTVGIFANQPKFLAGSIDINSSDKAARFIRFCDSFNIPLVSLVDVPGFLPGVGQEHGGIIRHGAKLLYAVAEATVPKIALILKKAYGGSYIAMASKQLGFDRVLAYPTAEIAVMGAEGAASIIFRGDIKNADNPDEMRKQKIEEFRESVMSPFIAAGYGHVDEIIEPKNSRTAVLRSLQMIQGKYEERPHKKHGNVPM